MTSPMQSKQGSGSRNLVRLCSHGWRVKKTSLIDWVFPAPKRDASNSRGIEMVGFLHAGRRREINRRVPSKMWRRFAFAPPSKAVLPAENDRGSYTTNNCARHALGAGGFGCFDHPSLSQPLQSCSVSLLPDKSRQSGTDLAADWRLDHSYIVQPRSSGHVPSGTAATAMHIVSRPPSTGLSPRRGLSMSAATLSGDHVHDGPVALRVHREAASLKHIQHGDIFREDLGDELTKSGFTAEGCEMAHQC